MIIETDIRVVFENGLAGTFSIDEDFEQVSFIPHEEDGEWCVSADSLMETGIADIHESFNSALNSDVMLDELRPVLSLIANILE